MADGFQVDLSALRAAAEGIRGTLEQVAASSTAPVGAETGHEGLAGALDEFVARWRLGVRSLAEDGRALADHLSADERAYRAGESSTHDQLDGVLRSTGPDPAAG